MVPLLCLLCLEDIVFAKKSVIVLICVSLQVTRCLTPDPSKILLLIAECLAMRLWMAFNDCSASRIYVLIVFNKSRKLLAIIPSNNVSFLPASFFLAFYWHMYEATSAILIWFFDCFVSVTSSSIVFTSLFNMLLIPSNTIHK